VEPTATPSEIRRLEVSKQLSLRTAHICNALSVESRLLHAKMVMKNYDFTS